MTEISPGPAGPARRLPALRGLVPLGMPRLQTRTDGSTSRNARADSAGGARAGPAALRRRPAGLPRVRRRHGGAPRAGPGADPRPRPASNGLARVGHRLAELDRRRLAYRAAAPAAGSSPRGRRSRGGAGWRSRRSPEIRAAWAELTPRLRHAQALVGSGPGGSNGPITRRPTTLYRQALAIAADLPEAHSAGLQHCPRSALGPRLGVRRRPRPAPLDPPRPRRPRPGLVRRPPQAGRPVPAPPRTAPGSPRSPPPEYDDAAQHPRRDGQLRRPEQGRAGVESLATPSPSRGPDHSCSARSRASASRDGEPVDPSFPGTLHRRHHQGAGGVRKVGVRPRHHPRDGDRVEASERPGPRPRPGATTGSITTACSRSTGSPTAGSSRPGASWSRPGRRAAARPWAAPSLTGTTMTAGSGSTGRSRRGGRSRSLRTPRPLPIAPGNHLDAAAADALEGHWIDTEGARPRSTPPPRRWGSSPLHPLDVLGRHGHGRAWGGLLGCVPDPSDLGGNAPRGSATAGTGPPASWRWSPQGGEGSLIVARAGATPEGPARPRGPRRGTVHEVEYKPGGRGPPHPDPPADERGAPGTSRSTA